MTPANIAIGALIALALIGAAIDWLPHFHNLGRVRVHIALRGDRAWTFLRKRMNLNVTAGKPATLVLVRTPDGAPVTDIAWTYDDNGTNVGSFHPNPDNLSGIFLGTAEGSATVSIACKSIGGVALTDGAQVTIAAAPPVEATAVSIQLA